MKSLFVAGVALVGMLTTPGVLAQSDAPAPPSAEDTQNSASEFARPGPYGVRPRLRPVAQDMDVRHARLGITVESTPEGLLVGEVEDDSMAAAAGLRSEDILVSLDGQRLRDVAHLRLVLARIPDEAEFGIGVIRSGEGLVKLSTRMQRPERRDGRFDGHHGGFLGVTLGEATDGGVTLDDVFEGTPAWYIGLEQGDVLLSIDGDATTSAEDVVGAVAARKPGTMITLVYSRTGDEHTDRVRLGRRAMNRVMGLGGSGRFPGFMPFAPRPGAFAWSSEDGQAFEGNLDLFLNDGQLFMGDLRDRMDDMLAEFDVDEHDVRINIRDGVLTIESDGEIQVFDLENGSAVDEEEQASDI